MLEWIILSIMFILFGYSCNILPMAMIDPNNSDLPDKWQYNFKKYLFWTKYVPFLLAIISVAFFLIALFISPIIFIFSKDKDII